MMRRWGSLLVFAVAVLGLVGGLIWLMNQQFKAGQAYPEASSLRSDPRGTRVLYEAYSELGSLAVSRNYTPFENVEDLPSDAVLLYLGADEWSAHSLATYAVVDNFVESGGTLVVALKAWGGWESEEFEEKANEAEAEDTEVVEAEVNWDTDLFWADLDLVDGPKDAGSATLVDFAEFDLPEQLPWRESEALVDAGAAVWRPVYQVDGAAVVVERSYGAGRIVVLTDDYLFSNEALLKYRVSAFLTWLLDDQTAVIFDETHLGVAEQVGIAVLMRRYRMGSFLAVFGLLMLCIVWRGAVPLLPAHSGRVRDAVVRVDQSSEAGLGDLVRRSVAVGDLPKAAWQQWRKSFVRTEADERYYAAEIEQVELLLRQSSDAANGKQKPHAIHSEIKSIINRKKRKRL